MDKPKLLIIAGCNGSGKSSFSRAFTPKETTSYDYDKIFKANYDALIPSDIRDVMAHNLSRENLESSINHSIKNNLNFCYETNFNSTPLFWAKKFKNVGYRIEIVYLCLNSIQIAKERVLIRFENGGHFVPDAEVEERYRLGYDNLNKHWSFFDSISLFETSKYNSTPQHIVTIEQNTIIVTNHFPKYLDKLLPNIKERLMN
ncbi:zeta toxin family protein [Pseudotamlana carrageenivorans]|uniref:Zeta toxin domain-containing protein n=1 Tax=Pseudotamlana carrageenivorans TaxID=2069432 RepID=A0A2I7SEC1_9FLAO|nr:zeta toxin family protein [Tamlana carrageenivorans]AUS04236.1 hypothetical protein C1A40_01535 [Tamlana carrageenivorans]